VPKKRAPLTFEQQKQLALAIGEGFSSGDDGNTSLLMILLDEIASNPFDAGHVEGLCHLVKLQLFAWSTTESDAAEEAYIKTQRECFFEAQNGGVQ